MAKTTPCCWTPRGGFSLCSAGPDGEPDPSGGYEATGMYSGMYWNVLESTEKGEMCGHYHYPTKSDSASIWTDVLSSVSHPLAFPTKPPGSNPNIPTTFLPLRVKYDLTDPHGLYLCLFVKTLHNHATPDMSNTMAFKHTTPLPPGPLSSPSLEFSGIAEAGWDPSIQGTCACTYFSIVCLHYGNVWRIISKEWRVGLGATESDPLVQISVRKDHINEELVEKRFAWDVQFL